MKVNDIINEGPLDWAKKAGSAMSGLVQNVKAYNQQQKALQDYKELASEAGQEWNALVAAYKRQPGMTPDQMSQLLVQFMDRRHKDKYNKRNPTNIPAPQLKSLNDAATANKYILDRMTEYFGRQGTNQVRAASLPTGYPLPTKDAEVLYNGNPIVFDAETQQWYNKSTGDIYADANSINLLNKKYYDQQKAGTNTPTAEPAVGDEPIKVGGQTLDPNNPDDKKIIDMLKAQQSSPAAPKAATPGVEKVVAEPVEPEPTSRRPKRDAEVDLRGKAYGFTVDDNQWHDDTTGVEIIDPNLVKQLNKRYYELKDLAKVGKAEDPDDPANDIIDPSNVIGANVGNNNKVIDINRGRKNWNPFADDDLRESRVIREGGNAIPTSTPVKKEDVATVVNQAKELLPAELVKRIQTDIGSAGYKVESGDIDVMVEAEDVVNFFNTHESKDPVKDAKLKLKDYFSKKGVEANVNGRNVSIGIIYAESGTGQKKTAQVDVMVIHEAGLVAPWHQHGLRGMYDDPEFKGSELFMLISSIAKHLGLKFDAFGAKLLRRDNNEVVGRTRKQVAKILLGPKAKEDDLNSVKSALKALENDPDREGKLAQARQDASKGLMRLPETVQPGTAAWFRQMSDVLG
jgi:hypothetical protein